MTSVTSNFHADTKTTIERNLPTPATPSGWITIGEYPSEFTLFGPGDGVDAAKFWRYLSSVADDMARHCELRGI